MKNSQKGFVGILVLIIIVALIVVFGIYFYLNNISAPTLAVSNATILKTYTNNKYGFTFDYPSDWQLAESANKTSATIDAGITANGLDAFTLVFTIVDNSAFESVQTKVGNISYDASQNALVDTSENARCLPYDNLRGLAGGVGSIQAFNYGGSTMSDPVYWESVILTNKNYMLDVGESYERPTDDATNQIIENGEQEIYSSLAFTNDVSIRLPSCATSGQ